MIPDITVKEVADGQFIGGFEVEGHWIGCLHGAHSAAHDALGCAMGRIIGGFDAPPDPYAYTDGVFFEMPCSNPPSQMWEPVEVPDGWLMWNQYLGVSPDYKPRHGSSTRESLKPDQIGHHRMLAAERLGLTTSTSGRHEQK